MIDKVLSKLVLANTRNWVNIQISGIGKYLQRTNLPDSPENSAGSGSVVCADFLFRFGLLSDIEVP